VEPKRTIEGWLTHAIQDGCLRVGRRFFASDLDRIETIEEEQKSLFDFCRLQGIVCSDIVLQRFEAGHSSHPTTPDLEGGNEHEAFYYEEEGRGRVIKVSLPDKFGRREHTPFLYLERLSLLNEMIPVLDIRFEDFIEADGGFSFITTMRYFYGSHPHGDQIAAYMQARGFRRHLDESTTLDFAHSGNGLIIRDCHPQNWIELEDGNLIPIDVIPELPPG